MALKVVEHNIKCWWFGGTRRCLESTQSSIKMSIELGGLNQQQPRIAAAA